MIRALLRRASGGLRRAAGAVSHRLRVRRADWRDLTLWALDLETGGLDPSADGLVAVGMVPVRAGVVVLGEAYETLIRPDRTPHRTSLTVHQILPAELEHAGEERSALEAVAHRLEDGVLLVHQRAIDVPFLRFAFRRNGIPLPAFVVVDTVELLHRYARRYGLETPERGPFPTGLADARAHFGLPPHRAHEALSDAVATAELFLVLAHRLGLRHL